MKHLFIIVVVSAFMLFAQLQYSNNALTASTGGSPIGYTGSPYDGISCIICHSGNNPVDQTGLIISNIPSDGYLPGETYTISATASRNGNNQFGFQIAAYNSSGSQAGILQSISSETNIQSAGKYITHTTLSTFTVNNIKTWIFEWTAPATGVGNITFYGAFVASNNNESASGDFVFTSDLQVQQKTSTNLNGSQTMDILSDLYPNPATDIFTMEVRSNTSQGVAVRLFDLQGRDMGALYSGQLKNGNNTLTLSLPENILSGIYTVLVTTEKTLFTRKISVR